MWWSRIIAESNYSNPLRHPDSLVLHTRVRSFGRLCTRALYRAEQAKVGTPGTSSKITKSTGSGVDGCGESWPRFSAISSCRQRPTNCPRRGAWLHPDFLPMRNTRHRRHSISILQPIRITWLGWIESSASMVAGINGLRSASLFVGAHKTTIAIFREARFCWYGIS